MLDKHTIRNGHLTGEAISGLACGTFDERDTALLLCHLEACPACMDAYIDAVSAADPAASPDGCSALEERILASIGKENRRAKNRVVLAGIVKMSVAVALTMLLFFSGAFRKLEESTTSFIQQISIQKEPELPPDRSKGSRWEQLASGYHDGFASLVDRIHAFFIGDDEHEHK